MWTRQHCSVVLTPLTHGHRRRNLTPMAVAMAITCHVHIEADSSTRGLRQQGLITGLVTGLVTGLAMGLSRGMLTAGSAVLRPSLTEQHPKCRASVHMLYATCECVGSGSVALGIGQDWLRVGPATTASTRDFVFYSSSAPSERMV